MPARGRTRRTASADPSRARILVAARSLFAERGFAGAATREIANAAGANQGLIAYHFGGKEALFREVVESELVRLAEALEAAPDGGSLAALLSAYLERAELVRLLAHALLEPGPRRAWLLGPTLAPALSQLHAILAGGRASALDQRDSVQLLTSVGAALALAAFGPALEAATGQALDRELALRAQCDALRKLQAAEPTRALLGPWAPRRTA